MFATRRMHVEVELMKWAVIILWAIALAAIMLVRTAGGDELKPAQEPGRLPADMGSIAKALAQPAVTPYFPENPPQAIVVDPCLTDELWGLVRQHEEGKVAAAMAGWKEIALPAKGEVWRHIAFGIGELQLGNLERADYEFDVARDYGPRHPLVAYYRGILRMEQAREQGLRDAEKIAVIRLVVYRNDEVVPATRGMYQLAAMVEFKDALARAEELNLAEPLVAEAGEEGPTVGDFLNAVGAVNYVGQTHNMLAVLYLDRGLLTDAEEQFDAAAATGIEIPFGYRDLGQAFEEVGENGDAVRAYLKAMTHHGAGWVRPGMKVWENLQKVFGW